MVVFASITLIIMFYKLLFLLIFPVILLSSCSEDVVLSKEQLLLNAISELEKRFEERKLGRIVEYVSVNYKDEEGRGLKDVKRVIQLQLMRHKKLFVFSTINDTQWIDEDNAQVKITAAMAGAPISSASLLTSIRADMIKFTVDFVLEDKIFKVKSAKWTWASPSDFID